MQVNGHDERILIIAPVGQDAAAMVEILATHGARTRICDGPADCARRLSEGAGALVLTEESLFLPDAPSLLKLIKTQPAWSELPVILLTSENDSRTKKLLDAAASAAGGITLLERPLKITTLRHSVEVALRSRRRQYLVRDLIEEQQRKRQELEQVQDTLRRANEFHEAVVTNMGEGLYTVDNKGFVTFINPAAEQLLGWTAKELRGRKMHNVTHYKHRDGSPFPGKDCAGLKVLRTGQPLAGHEDVFIRKDGTFFDVIFSASPIRENGKITGLAVVFRDTTDRKRTWEVKNRLAAIVEHSEDAIVGKNLDGIITSWNRGAEQLFGYTAQEAIGQPITILIPKDRLNEEPDVLRSIRRGKPIRPYETVRRRKDGTLLDISLTVSPVRDESGKIVGASKIARNITERKRADAELVHRTLQQKALYDLADTLNRSTDFGEIYSASLDAIKICLSAQRASVLLFDEDKVLRFKAWSGISDEYRAAVEGHSPWQHDTRDACPICVNDAKQSDLTPELRGRLQKEGIAALAFIPIGYQGRLLGKFMVYYNAPHAFVDSEMQLGQTIANQLAFGLARKKNDDALRSAGYRLANQAKELGRLVDERTVELTRTNKQLEAFVYSVAHDLRGPLRSMQGFSEMLLEEPGLTEAGKDFAGRIHRSSRHMDQLLADLLNFSRLSQQQLELVPTSLETVVHTALSRLEEPIRQKHAHVDSTAGWPRVMAHETTLTQVVINLVDNGIKFVEPDKTPIIRLRAEERGAFVRLWVIDNGIGIGADYQEEAFRLFTRLNGADYPGTGVGLAIVKKGIERMGGHVGVESGDAPGSRFWIELPKA